MPVDVQPHHSRMEPLWDRVDRNRFKLIAVTAAFVVGSAIGLDIVLALLLLAAYPFWLYNSVLHEFPVDLGSAFIWTSVAGLVLGLVWAAYVLTRSETWFLRYLGATVVPKGELLDTKYALKDMAIAAGMPVAPALFLIETDNVNAFVLSHARRRPVIGVTAGLVRRLSHEEQRAVFAALVARIRSGDTMYATGVTALALPVWLLRDRLLRDSADKDLLPAPPPVRVVDPRTGAMIATRASVEGADGAALMPLLLVPAFAFVVVTELIAFGSQASLISRAEKADAEGMLLLKDPRSMLSALERCIRYNNFVPGAGPGFGQLFYCWTGDATDDEDDPEMERVARLREVLGVEGVKPPERVRNERMLAPPVAPRIEE